MVFSDAFCASLAAPCRLGRRASCDTEATKRKLWADEVGIHFRGTRDHDIILDWGETASVDAARCDSTDGSMFLEVYVYHISGVDFRFHDVEDGYGQVMEAMERHLVGFSRAKAEAAQAWDKKLNTPVVWKRNEAVQPFQLRPEKIDTREPTEQELVQMEAARQASIATCEKLLGRPLEPEELECIYTGFESGRIVGNIAAPLCDLLVKRQAEILGRATTQ